MDVWLVLFVSTAFASATGIAFSVGALITSRNRLQRRLPAGARALDASALTSPDTMVALAGEPFKEDRFGLGQKLSKELRLKLVRAGYFSPGACPLLCLCACMRRHCDAVACLAGRRNPFARSVDAEFRAHRGSLRRDWGPRARRLSVAPPVCATCGISTEFSGSLRPVDGLRHRGPDGGGVLRQNPRSAQQAKPSARLQHRIDGGRDARGKKLS